MEPPDKAAADWYPDPFGRHEHRYWDGARWTEHVASAGRQNTDAPIGAPAVPTTARRPERIARDVTKTGLTPTQSRGATPGAGSIFTEPVMVVNQKVKLVELTNEYAIYDQHAKQIGAVRQVGQGLARKAVRLLTSFDQFLSHVLQVVDMTGTPVLVLRRPAKLLKSRVIVEDAMGRSVGEIRQRNAIGKIRFALSSGDVEVGSLNAENWRAWNFNIQDAQGTEVARITKTWEGLAKTMFTTADNYVVQIHKPLDEPLRSLVIAAALAVDTALKQDSRGFG